MTAGLSRPELAEAAGVATVTIARFEAGLAKPYAASLEKLQAELERRGIDVINGEGPGVRLNLARAAEAARSRAVQ